LDYDDDNNEENDLSFNIPSERSEFGSDIDVIDEDDDKDFSYC